MEWSPASTDVNVNLPLLEDLWSLRQYGLKVLAICCRVTARKATQMTHLNFDDDTQVSVVHLFLLLLRPLQGCPISR